jgi:hypothetical protein
LKTSRTTGHASLPLPKVAGRAPREKRLFVFCARRGRINKTRTPSHGAGEWRTRQLTRGLDDATVDQEIGAYWADVVAFLKQRL